MSRAAALYEDAARMDHVDACIRTATCYLNGEGVFPQVSLAMKWFVSAAEKGSVEGMLRAADLFAEGGQSLDAFVWYQRAAAKSALGKYKLAMCHLTGFGTPEDKGNAYRILAGLAEFGTPDVMPDACCRLAAFLEERGEMIGAARYYHRAAALGCEVAYEHLRSEPRYRKGLFRKMKFSVTQSKYQAESGSYRPVELPWIK